jgi:hypothetical protein
VASNIGIYYCTHSRQFVTYAKANISHIYKYHYYVKDDIDKENIAFYVLSHTPSIKIHQYNLTPVEAFMDSSRSCLYHFTHKYTHYT